MRNAEGRMGPLPGRCGFWGAWGLLTLAFLAGCAPYQIRGVVLEGAAPMVAVVDAGDPRLQKPGLEGATVRLVLGPREIKPKTFGPTFSDGPGQFSLPITELGAGFLEFDALMVAQKSGYKSAWTTLRLPGAGQRLLIILAPGRDDQPPPGDILRDTLDLGRSLQRD